VWAIERVCLGWVMLCVSESVQDESFYEECECLGENGSESLWVLRWAIL
jgi:hypothetical protein